jgi:Na+/proline symporter
MGSWTLFSFPEIGVLAGTWGVIGYTLSGVLGMLVLGWAGPYTRALLGDGVTLTDWVNNRFGRVMQIYIALISVFYQFISLASELTCVGSLAVILSPGADPVVPIICVAVITNIYLLIGGLRASLATDVWQGIAVVSLVFVVLIAMAFTVTIPENAWKESDVAAFTTTGFETLVTLCIAITASNLFFTGFWQRVFSGADDATVRRASVYACFIIIPFTVALAVSGMVSSLAYPDGTYYFFSVLLEMGRGWQVLVAIVIASLASSVCDSIQIGISAEIVANFPGLTLFHARTICLVLNIPAIVIATKAYDILTLFLIADLLCTAAVGPMLLGAWKRATVTGAISGSIAGLLTIFVCGVAYKGTFIGGFEWFGLPDGLYASTSMVTFIVTLIVPTATTVLVSLAMPSKEPFRSDYLPAATPVNFA